ncbi:hypothetical protein ACFL2H_12885 [Planctomycetota bacterium]
MTNAVREGAVTDEVKRNAIRELVEFGLNGSNRDALSMGRMWVNVAKSDFEKDYGCRLWSPLNPPLRRARSWVLP